jgi:peptide/nickel transport system permease protein
VFVESIFSVPGIGELLVSSIDTRDQTMLQAIALLIAVVTILANLISDLLYIAVDPRVRLGRRSA